MKTESLTFQDGVARLQSYWSDQGCLIWQPHNVEVGAGTMNPATFLQVIGPEPWNVAYFEPSIRPDDARYGENPNRMGRHHQMQVILKPDPGDPQQLFLESLRALGIDLARHDIRFVEDNWEAPALGAWGLGWEVWLDGLEITQFTYFQQAGSLDLDPVSVEITYGLDRILMAIQDARHFRDLRWSKRVSGVHVQSQMEIQTSRYYFESADVDRLRQLYDLYEAEALHALDSGLAFVAHDYLLKCSHAFNVLDARGAVGVTERAAYFGRMRRVARAVAEVQRQSREELGHPLLQDGPWIAGTGSAAAEAASAEVDIAALPTGPADFLLEVGTEELPVADLDLVQGVLRDRVPQLLNELRLDHGAVTVLGTPRRSAVLVSGLAPRQADVETYVVGPPVAAAYDSEGVPTKAAEGFARSAGVSVDELAVEERGGQERIAALKKELGRPAAEVLAPVLPQLLAGMTFERSMRWNSSGQSFSRPVRWLACLHGEAVVPVEFAGLVADRLTRGTRPAGSPVLSLARADDYIKLMMTHGIEVDAARRRSIVLEQVKACAAQIGGQVADDPDLVNEVANLVEQPCAILGAFDEKYLDLPAQVLTTVMKKHQRYFPVVDDAGELKAAFVTVLNGAGLDEDAVRHGNEAVVRARFADAAYFWERDKTQSLDDFTPRLATLTFQSDLGSVLDKVRRLEEIAPALGQRLGIAEDDSHLVARAAALSKSDLATEMVVDFTSLQGIMGREYAGLSGEPVEVADAIYEQYLPRGADALADRLDSLVGLFAVGVKPTGTTDPYALRRAALGVTSILVYRELEIDLKWAVDVAAAAQPVDVSDADKTEVLEFLARRLEGQLRDAGHPADVVAAVLARQAADPAAAAGAVRALEQHVARDDWQTTLDAYARCARIVRDRDDGRTEVDAGKFERPAEHVLFDAFEAAVENLDAKDLNEVLHVLAALAPAIHTYFDEVLVMDEAPELRENKLSMVRRIADVPAFAADMSKLEGF
jgi:glycyl-tRNA synthetase